jgi:DNA-binding NarL/FixJ family response regulator
MSDRRANHGSAAPAAQLRDGSPRPGSEPGPDIYERGSAREPGARVRVVVAEDSYMIREFLISVLNSAPDLELVGVCTTSRELQLAVSSLHPDVIVTDIRMPPAWTDDGIRIAARLRDTNPEIGVVVLSQYADPSYALALLARGTQRRSYLLKERIRNSNDLIAAIKAVAEGGSVIDPAIVDVLIEARSKAAHSRLSHLTPRERQLLGEIAVGKSNAAIATSLFLTKRAVEKHVNSIFAKLDLPETEDVSRRVAAALIYLSEQTTDPPVTPVQPR